MLRKFLIFFTILLIAFLGYFSYKLLREKEITVNSIIDAIPVDASVIIEINRPQVLIDFVKNPIIDAGSFFSIPLIRDLLDGIKDVDSFTSKSKEAGQALMRPHSSIISCHPVGKDEFEYIYYLKLEEDKEFKAFDRLIKQSIQGKGNLSVHNYDDAQIADVTISNSKSAGFSYVYYRGLFVLSKSSILLEEVIRQTKSSVSIRSNPGLETVLRTSGKGSPFNIYINFDHFPTLALNLIHSRFKPDLNAISRFAHWIELDCNINNNAIVLNGFASTENANGFLSDIFEGQEPVNLMLPGLLPAETKSFFALGISNFNKFCTNFANYQAKNDEHPDYEKSLHNYKKETGMDLASEFSKIFDQELCFAFCPGAADTISNNIFTIIRTKGAAEAKEFIASCSANSIDESSTTPGKKVFVLNKNIPKLLFGNIFTLNDNRLCIVTDNYLIFGDSLSRLNDFAEDFTQQNNLGTDFSYRNLSNLLSEDAYCYFYLSPEASQFYRYFLKYTSEQMLSQYKYGLSQVQAIVYQFGRNDKLLYNNAFILFEPKSDDKVTKRWELQLDNPPITPITLAKNYTSGENDIILQDQGNNLYLISANGELIWKRKLKEKILGQINQADLFTNKKLQFVFNTASSIMAIDKNGKDVEGFPLKLKSPAITGMACVDYDKNRNYRFLVLCKDNTVHCLDKKGEEPESWKRPEVTKILGNIQFFTSAGKDFITFYDGKKIYFLDRRGKERLNTDNYVSIAPNSGLYGYTNKNTFQFVCTDSTGAINTIALNGNVTKVRTGIYPANHYFFLGDIDFNNISENIFFYQKKIEAYTSTGARVLSIALDGEVTRPPKIIHVNDSSFLFAYTDTFKHQIYLLNDQGSKLKGTPLEGNSEITYDFIQNPNQILNIYFSKNNILTSYSVN